MNNKLVGLIVLAMLVFFVYSNSQVHGNGLVADFEQLEIVALMESTDILISEGAITGRQLSNIESNKQKNYRAIFIDNINFKRYFNDANNLEILRQSVDQGDIVVLWGLDDPGILTDLFQDDSEWKTSHDFGDTSGDFVGGFIYHNNNHGIISRRGFFLLEVRLAVKNLFMKN